MYPSTQNIRKATGASVAQIARLRKLTKTNRSDPGGGRAPTVNVVSAGSIRRHCVSFCASSLDGGRTRGQNAGSVAIHLNFSRRKEMKKNLRNLNVFVGQDAMFGYLNPAEHAPSSLVELPADFIL